MPVKLTKAEASRLGLLKKPRAKRAKPAPPQLNGPGPVMQMWLRLPMPPSDNDHHQYGRGRVHLSKEAKAWRQLVAAEAFGKGHVVGKVAVHVWVGETGLDTGNIVKELGDALEAARVFANDRQIIDWRVRKSKECVAAGMISVQITGEYPGGEA